MVIMEKYTTIPTVFSGYTIIVNDRVMVWQDNVIYKGYCYLGL